MSSELEILVQLKQQLVDFLDELIESFPNEPDFIIFRIFVNDQIPIIDIMKYITEKLCPLHDMVKRRDEKFFADYNVLFEKFDEKKTGKVNYFKRIWFSGGLDKEDKEVIWRWFHSFLVLGNKYIELQKNVSKYKDV